ncbi:MAG: class I SAM-dependent RNA methyltransferase, partial [Gemmatimonadaceae bacterium]
VKKGSRFARAELRTLRVASPERVEPLCMHYTRDKCGGCQLQHISYNAQLKAKARIIRDAFERIGKRAVAAIHVRPSAPQWRYRRKLTLALRRREISDDGSRIGSEWIAGLHPFDDPANVFPLEECPITGDAVMDIWRAILRAESLLPDARSLRGAVRVDQSAATFVLEGGNSWPGFEGFMSAVPELNAIWWTPARGTRRLMTGGEPNAQSGAVFLQVNASVAAELQHYVVQRTMAYRPDRVIDAYSGIGEIASVLSDAGVQTTAIDLDPAAVARCAQLLPFGSRAIAGRVEELLSDFLPADVVLLNPPRTGIDANVCEALQRVCGATRAIIYTSCNPATLARDVARLPGYRVARIEAFDMFPQTAHVETVCELVPGET